MLHRFTLRVTLLLVLLAPVRPVGAQTFTKITSGNPIATATVPASSQYTGCAWADYDGDGDPDFYIVQQGLYRNNGAGSFTLLAAIPADHTNAIGCSWADPDNDGDLDLFVAGGPPGGSVFYRNDGADAFTAAATGVMGDVVGNQGWGCAWADYDLDGKADLAISAAFGFVGITTSNHMLHNLGALAFERVDTSAVSAVTGPFTTPSWNDVDDDGDPDLFIASGPADGTTAPDFLYENRRAAPGETFFVRTTTGALATDAHDGQLYNWVDIDSDGDLDVYVTNYGGPSGGFSNDLYRNDGGTFVRLSAVAAGPIVTQASHSLASVWSDFDNDGDLDCLVTNDGPEFSQFYTNNGAGLFTGVAATALRAAGPHYGAAAADYDGDGDVDVYMHGTTATRGLFRNNSNPTSTNGWLDVRCVGTVSNRAALGARVWVRATIGGVSKILVQQVSAQNSFGGHNAFSLHFGLGNATVVDSVIVGFPNGGRQILTGVAIRQSITVIEEVPAGIGDTWGSAPRDDGSSIEWLGGNPARANLRLAVTLPRGGDARLRVIDSSGRVVLRHDDRGLAPGRHRIDLGPSAVLRPGIYWVRMDHKGVSRSARVVVLR